MPTTDMSDIHIIAFNLLSLAEINSENNNKERISKSKNDRQTKFQNI